MPRLNKKGIERTVLNFVILLLFIIVLSITMYLVIVKGVLNAILQ